MAKPELGGKRQCQSCSTKFFDMNKDPILCPKCGTVFVVTASSRTAARAAVADDDGEIDTAAADHVPLADADAGDEKAEVVVADDIEIEEEPADAFLEEEEEDGDDVSGLIDGDIETDEEA